MLFNYIESTKIFNELKNKYKGNYSEFNTKVTNKEIYNILPIDSMIKNSKNFKNFEDFCIHYLSPREKQLTTFINYICKKYSCEFNDLTFEDVKDRFFIRVGNCYFGNFNESNIIEAFKLINWIEVEKTSDYVDKHYKVDAVLTVPSISKFGIQIKPESRKYYYKKFSEVKNHEDFEKEFNIKVYYLYYNKNNIILNDLKGDINDIKSLENIIYSMVNK